MTKDRPALASPTSSNCEAKLSTEPSKRSMPRCAANAFISRLLRHRGRRRNLVRTAPATSRPRSRRSNAKDNSQRYYAFFFYGIKGSDRKLQNRSYWMGRFSIIQPARLTIYGKRYRPFSSASWREAFGVRNRQSTSKLLTSRTILHSGRSDDSPLAAAVQSSGRHTSRKSWRPIMSATLADVRSGYFREALAVARRTAHPDIPLRDARRTSAPLGARPASAQENGSPATQSLQPRNPPMGATPCLIG